MSASLTPNTNPQQQPDQQPEQQPEDQPGRRSGVTPTSPALVPAPPAGVIASLDWAFRMLVVPPDPLGIDGWPYTDLPSRLIPLDQLRTRLVSADVGNRTRARVWAYLVRQARGRGPRRPAWTVGLAGVALPELIRVVANLTPGYHGDAADLEAAALGGFLSELRRVDPCHITEHHPGIRVQLLRAGYRAARALRDATHTPATGPAASPSRDRPATHTDASHTDPRHTPPGAPDTDPHRTEPSQ